MANEILGLLEQPVRVRLLQRSLRGVDIAAIAAKVSVSRKPLERIESMPVEERDEWLRTIISRGHGSPLEHVSYTFEVVCSRVCSHQLVRHRIASYTQLSMRHSEAWLKSMAGGIVAAVGRYCPGTLPERELYRCYADALGYTTLELIVASEADISETEARGWLERIARAASKAYVFPPHASPAALHRMLVEYVSATEAYFRLLAEGVPREDARYVIPGAVKTRLIVTMNARELLEVFLPLRMCTRAQWEIRMVAWQMWRELMRSPDDARVFRYAGPRCVALDRLTRRDGPHPLEDYLSGRVKPAIERCPELVPRDGILKCLLYAASALESKNT